MYQIDNSTAATSLPAISNPGTPGFFTDGNPATGQAPTIVPAEWLNTVMMELSNAVSASGQTPTKGVLNQLARAIQMQAAPFIVDSGSANAYVVTLPVVVSARTEGQVIRFKAKTSNTGASTLNDGLGVVPLVGGAHQSLQGGEIIANGDAWVQWNSSVGVNGSYILLECTGGALQVGSAAQSGHAVNLGQVQGLFVGKNSAGNAGVGTTPSSSWAPSFAAMQLGAVAAVASDPNSAYMGSNWVSTSSGDIRIQSGSAVRVMLNSSLGTMTVQYAGNGSAGSAITWQTIFSGSATGVSLPNGVTFPTASPGDNSTNGATTAFVANAVSGKVNAATTLAGYGITDGVNKDSQGNVGVGATTQTWDTMFPVIQQNARSVYAADANSTYMGGNWYHASGAFKRLGSGFGLMYQQNAANGAHTFSIAATGAANSTVTWTSAMTIDANGNIGINTTPLTWGGSYPAIQLNSKTAIAADANSTYYGTNWYAGVGGADTAIAAGYGTQYFQNSSNGAHTWRTSASVSAGGAISWVNSMVLSQAGVLSVPAGMTTYTQSATDNSTNVATTAQVYSAINNAIVANPSSTGGLNFLVATNQIYQIRHGAVSLGSGTSAQSVTFATAFPNNCYVVVITSQGTQSGPTATSCAQSYSKYGFTIQNYTGIATTFSYIAIGA
ncbi:hypothetical protein LQD23_16565 [Chromobacterium violaceum]|uniref:gp53-like domain-containing protein n=1 Tax=Chromobacterium violaceum TaxID=536 RepID=UPI001E605CB9|nr:hypothetical protein [Chromobacterium violaceum]MCD0493896.1 hypothetical protein [Chromobacterium violaceum]